ncbi:MAG: hypothetical protein GTO51_05495 [Candidatus Latescibacteria bacterium]|nr:hypothetical protein [Candidatus Latescibacterota bacterium]NIO28458.1 hypothetical protein [Candidatus Latescibacterota bacterium]NIO56007.1 hypothetical protein [Candidatus Latescibacterota bacterium]NIT01971.1 hypothetical protein [Candidatus Latescibacterota bacterium]
MRDKIIFILYFGSVVSITYIHNIGFLLAGLGVVALISQKSLPRIAKKAAIAIAFFNFIVTISYCTLSVIKGNFSIHYIALINLRVFLLTSLTFLVAGRINPFKALGLSRSILYLLTLAYSQVLTMQRLFDEFRQARRSRSIARLSMRDMYRHGASTGAFLLRKSINDATEISQAMRSRGFFND